jgi:hypothetical protein
MSFVAMLCAYNEHSCSAPISVPPIFQVRVGSVEDPAWASFCESFEKKHSDQSLTGGIARVSPHTSVA